MAEELNLDIFIEEREVSLSMEPKINDLNSQKKKKKKSMTCHVLRKVSYYYFQIGQVMCKSFVEERRELIQTVLKDRSLSDLPVIKQVIITLVHSYSYLMKS